MKMIVVVKDKAAYKAWMASKKKETFKDKYFPAPAAPVAAAVVDTTMTN
jgi:heme/copper-type cytochrome/quinol oxidase subunit 2